MAKKPPAEDMPPFPRSPYMDRSAHARPYDPFAQRLRPSAREAEAAVPATRIPVSRCLKIYTQDPATPRQNIPVANVQVPSEPLAPGPNGRVMCVIDKDDTPGASRSPRPSRRQRSISMPSASLPPRAYLRLRETFSLPSR